VEPANTNRYSSSAELARNIHAARELICLHAHQPNEPFSSPLLDPPDYVLCHNARVRFIERRYADIYV
jgi:hypothetical protein